MDESLNLQTPGSDERTNAQNNQRLSQSNGAPRQSYPSDAVTEGVEGDGLRRQRMPPKRSARSPSSSPYDKDAGAIAAELRRRLGGEVRFDAGSRALYATDASNYRQVPIGVVIPETLDDVVQAVAVARRFGAPVLARGGGTSLAGQCCNVALVIDFSKYLHHIVDLDPDRRVARVEPGVVLDDLRDAAENHHLTFGPDPSTHNHCTLGGMIGNNSCGVHSVMAGKTDDNIQRLEILTYDGARMWVGPTSDDELDRIIGAGGRRGEIYQQLGALRDRYADLIRQRFPDIPRRVSGYNLSWLLPENGFNIARALVGSESTCVTVLQAEVRLVHSPPVRSLLVLGYPDVYSAGDHIADVLAAKPIALEGLDDRLVDDMKKKHLHPQPIELLPPGAGWLLAEFGGESNAECDEQAHRLMDRLRSQGNAPSMKLFTDPAEGKTIWLVRRSGLGATARVPGAKDTWEGWEDSAVPPDKLGGYLRELRQLFNKYDYAGALYGHFGQGCVHTRIDFDLLSQDGIAKYRSFIHEAADLVIGYGGSLSGEHGDGQSRGELLPKMFGSELMEAFRQFKRIWDPQGKMNPGKVIDAYRADENLRLGVDYHPPQPATHFKFPGDDRGSFARATLRCVGVGECRRESVGTMCPSYRVTREEMHSTRGRARLLFEMLQGDPLKAGWRSDAVREALDLCLACKGCKSDCPVNVDMATYKAEFFSHYYKNRLRPRHAYAMGWIHRWARLASLAPGLANLLAHTPVLRGIAKALGGIAQEREIPTFAPRTFCQSASAHQHADAVSGFGLCVSGSRNKAVSDANRRQVLLWVDTFNNHFFPEVAEAAVEVLEAAGCAVLISTQPLCCGRPLYDFGMLDQAEHLLGQILAALRPQIAAGMPVVGLEPSCVATLRDELVNLFPNDEDAQRLSRNSFLLNEFLARSSEDWKLPKFPRKALVHGHCHQKAVMGMKSDKAVFDKLGLDYRILDSGCCGMAGSFGFEAGHYQVSRDVGELVLLPAVRDADAETLIIADGFSCREQIAQLTPRRALHSAQVMQLALRQSAGAPNRGLDGENGAYAESSLVASMQSARQRSQMRTLLGVGAGALLGAALYLGWRSYGQHYAKP